MHRILLFALYGMCAVACTGGGTPDAPPTELTADERTQRDILAFEQLADQLLTHATVFGRGLDELQAYGPNLFWLRYGGVWNPTVFAMRPGGTTSDDGVPITELDGDEVNYRVSDAILVTAVRDFGEVAYRAHDFDGNVLGETVLPSPGGGVRWWSYAADGDTIFVVQEDDDLLSRFTPGAAPQALTTFTELGVSLGRFEDFDVEGDELAFIESGRVWLADLGTGSAQWLGNATEASSIATSEHYVVYVTATGLMIHDRATGTTSTLSDRLADYALSETFSSVHQRNGGTYSLIGDVLVYVASGGIFAYDIAQHHVEPILLEGRWDGELRVVYLNPTVTSEGVLYVKGLESTSGSVGADGPIYRVEHPFLVDRP